MLSTADAVAASVECGRRLGLTELEPQVVAEGYSVRVWLAPHPVVTRVVTVGVTLRGDLLPWMEREVDVAAHLVRAGAPVVGPWREAGPHDVDGVAVSLWQHARAGTAGVTVREFGAVLGELHAALDSYDADLPLLVGPLTDVATALERSDDATLHRAAAVLVPRTWPRRPLHGDAHLGNVLPTSTGPQWIDFEDVCLGPTEWDLASATLTDDAVAAYPGAVDQALLADCRACAGYRSSRAC